MKEYTALISHTAHRFSEALSGYFDVIEIPSYERLDMPVSSHPDMLIFYESDTVIVPAEYIGLNGSLYEQLTATGNTVIKDDSVIVSREYPGDISFNVLDMEGFCFGRKPYVSAAIRDLIDRSGKELVDVRQGYAACSAASGGTFCITADPSLRSAVSEHGMDVLMISAGSVRLKGYDYGFIGGASGYSDGSMYFFGDVTEHPDGNRIRDFLKEHGCGCISLGTGPLEDHGGIRFLKNK